jgi:fermentation-respiration switch protein FrsA (DUF1100 family)
MSTERASFKSEGQTVAAILHLPEEANPPCVIASHGLLSSKDTDKYIVLRERLSEEGMPSLGRIFFEDLPKHRLLPLLRKVSNRVVIHGEADKLVPADQAWEIFRSLGSPKEIHVIEDADHRLTNPNHRQRAMDFSIEWFKRYL